MRVKTAVKKYWFGIVHPKDDFDDPIMDEFIDGKMRLGPWAIMTPRSWSKYGVRRLGTGFGQRYRKQPDERWLKVEG